MEIITTKAQKRIFTYVIAGILIILIFWGLVYLPSRRHVQRFQSQLDEVEKQLNKVKEIKEVKEAISKGYVYTQSVEGLRNELAGVVKNIATEQESPLKYISSSVRQLNLEMVSIKPSSKKPLLDKNKKQIKVAGAVCFQLPVQLRLKGSYIAIVKYIEALRKNAPSLIAVEDLKINKATKAKILTADANLVVYLRAEK